jgi:dTDP-4-dehydrorhamnose 3,5-epimerase
MIFEATPIADAFVIVPELVEDARGAFARTFCREEFQRQGLEPLVSQCNVSVNTRRGTLRGLHYQAAPHEECKLVRCTTGAIFDVIVDLRPSSPTHRRWFGVELSATNRRALYIPRGCAHGFQSLTDGSEVLYQMSYRHHPEAARGVRWDDPAIGVTWPIAEPILNDRDRSYPLLGARE